MTDEPSTDQTRAVAATATAAYMAASNITFAAYMLGLESGGRTATIANCKTAQAVSCYAGLRASAAAARAARCESSIDAVAHEHAIFWAGCDDADRATIEALDL